MPCPRMLLGCPQWGSNPGPLLGSDVLQLGRCAPPGNSYESLHDNSNSEDLD